MKTCGRCSETLPPAAFNKNNSMNKNGTTPKEWDGLQAYCRECQKKDKMLRRYGLTEEGYASLLQQQGGKCAICGTSARLVVDHCHGTDAVRGLLCNACNVLLGQAGDSVEVLQFAIQYLREREKI